ncbi:MAG: DedA family protein [Chloroflexota bacterium]
MVAAILFYLGLGALLTLEEAGLFLLPGDISLVAAGLHASPYRLHFFISWGVASLGMVLGSSILFHGVARARAFNRVLPRRVRYLVRRFGVGGVAGARMIPGLRNATVFAAASARMRYTHFLWGLVPAAIVWSGLLLVLGWFGGSAMLSAFGTLHHSRILTLASLSLLLAIVLFVVYRIWSQLPHHLRKRK